MVNYSTTEEQTQGIPNDHYHFGGFWMRLAAFIIDCVVFGVPLGVVSLIIIYNANFEESQLNRYNDISSYVIALFWLVYYSVFHSSEWQATIGKKVVGLKVVDVYGNRISFARAVGRYFSMFLSTITLFVGFMMIGWTKHKQGLHDFIAGTYVIKSSL